MRRETKRIPVDKQKSRGPWLLRISGSSVVCPIPRSGRLTIGSDPSNDLHLDDEWVSKFHAYLDVSPEPFAVVLTDRGSKNGTWLNGARVAIAHLPCPATLRIGHVRIDVELSDSATRPGSAFNSAAIVGNSRAMRALCDQAIRAARTSAHVLICGESGTGKELLARFIHEQSQRKSQPLVVDNCGAIPRELCDSQFFGHERGAFTGATDKRAGLFEMAHGGTLFLDEIGELPLELQPRLLRVLETKRIRSVGGSTERLCDVRIVAATHRNLVREISAGRFRLDLFHRLSAVTLTIPPLRERREDIPAITQHLLHSMSDEIGKITVAADGMAALMQRSFPGNVRELRNTLLRAALWGGEVLTAKELASPELHEHHPIGERFRGGDNSGALVAAESQDGGESPFVLAGSEKLLGEAASYHKLVKEAGSLRRAAQRLGIPKSTFADRLRRLGVDTGAARQQ